MLDPYENIPRISRILRILARFLFLSAAVGVLTWLYLTDRFSWPAAAVGLAVGALCQPAWAVVRAAASKFLRRWRRSLR